MHIGIRVRNSPRRTREEKEGGDHPRRGGGARDSQRRSLPTRYGKRPVSKKPLAESYLSKPCPKGPA